MRSVGEGWKTRNPNPDDESLLEDDVDEGKHEHKGQQGEGYWRCLMIIANKLKECMLEKMNVRN